jgi:6,7-dimethyl-8-ribityllumazine synthase
MIMPNVKEGKLEGKGVKLALLSSRFNSLISEHLEKGCVDVLIREGVEIDDIDIYRVPGSFEIPLVAQKLASATKKYDAIICLGAVIKGETPHFDFVAAEVSKGIAKVGLENDIPVIFGVVTTNNLEEAINRAGVKRGNKGAEAAMAALEMVDLLKQIEKGK